MAQRGETHGYRVTVVKMRSTSPQCETAPDDARIHQQSGQRHRYETRRWQRSEWEDDDDGPATTCGHWSRGGVHRGPHAWLDRPRSQERFRKLFERGSSPESNWPAPLDKRGARMVDDNLGVGWWPGQLGNDCNSQGRTRKTFQMEHGEKEIC